MQHLNIQEHFNVPEGYFEQLTQQITDKLPEQPFQPMNIKKPTRHYLWYAVAAVVAALVVAIPAASYLLSNDNTPTTAATAVQTEPAHNNEAYSIDDAAEYAMIDHQDIYEMITE